MPDFDEIEIEKITLGKPNVRKIDVDLEIDELARSIEEQGLLQPIIVHKLGDEFELIAGQRRLTALIKLGRPTIPAMIVDTSDQSTMMLISLIENVQRVDIDDRDRAAAIEQLVDTNRGDYAAVAKMLGMSERTIRAWSGYHGVPEELKKMKDEGLLDRDTAISLNYNLGHEKVVAVAKELVKLPKKQHKKALYGIRKFTAIEPEEAIFLATKDSKQKHVTIRFMATLMAALERAAAARGETTDQTVQYIVREWLEKRHYLQS